MMNQKVALVTGANRGIGFETVRQLLKRGYKTILTSRNEERGRSAMEKLEAFGGMLHYLGLDVVDDQSVLDAATSVERDFGRLDILVNNAAINYDTWQKAVDADLDQVRETLNVNLLGPWRMCQAFLPLMRKNGYGRIVNVSSESGSMAEMGGGTPAYGVSKAALNALTIKLGAELRGTGVLVNSVCPGWVRTEMGGPGAPRSPEKGTETIIWLAELPANGPTGKFFRDKRELSF